MRWPRARKGLLAAGVALACSSAVTGCAATEADDALLSADTAAYAVGRALEMPLAEESTTDVPALSDLVARYKGGDLNNHVVLLIFDSVASTEQVTGDDPSFRADLTAVSERNVVVMLGGRGLAARRAAVAGALRSAASGSRQE